VPLSLPSPPNQPPVLTVPDADSAIRVSLSLYLARLVAALVKGWISVNATWAPGTVANQGFVSATVTMRGISPPQPVYVGFTTAIPAGMVLHAVCTSTDTVTVTLVNFTGSSQNIASGTLRVTGSPTI
jgi:hypothetical protein